MKRTVKQCAMSPSNNIMQLIFQHPIKRHMEAHPRVWWSHILLSTPISAAFWESESLAAGSCCETHNLKEL